MSVEQDPVGRAESGEEAFERWQREAAEPRAITIQRVADWYHSGFGQKPERGEHLTIHSCACMHIARSLFGLDGIEHLYWPDGKGGNQWRE